MFLNSEPYQCKAEWEDSYRDRGNFVFYPHEEVIRFFSKYIRKRTGLDEFTNIETVSGKRALDLGCGIGRHVIYCYEMGLEAYGIDLSDSAIQVAIQWAARKELNDPEKKIIQGDVRKLPWPDGFFDFALSHGVLDSMSFQIASAACAELARTMKVGGLFYCDLISGDDSAHPREYADEEVVVIKHEQGTIQSYFNLSKIRSMLDGLFEIVECFLIRKEEVVRGGHTSRYHLVLRKI
jgi:ubiquinone/menaquinone biosynthesis C-methylase UbiE